MKKVLLLAAVGLLSAGSLQAQRMFFDAQFDYTVQSGVYGQNISILPVLRGGTPVLADLVFKAYIPQNTGSNAHPVVIISHTGSFLPPLANGGYTGSIDDSVVVNTAIRLAQRGYVAIAASYRAGWNPIAEDQETRTRTLLQAAYRGTQDFKTAVRYLKNQAANGNDLKVDTNRIAGWGYGTGGYNVVNANFLDRIGETQIEKFIGSDDAPFIMASVHGDVEGKTMAQLNVPNWVNHSSEFHFAVNAGGALGDSTWIEGKPDEAPTVGIQAQFDPFAPFYAGAVIVPTTRQFVVDVAGGLLIVDRANRLGVNDPLDAVNAQLRADSDPITLYADGFRDVTFTTRENAISRLSVENFLPRVRMASLGLDFVDSTRLAAVVAGYNAVTGDTITARRLVGNDRLSNPNTTSPLRAKAALDTVMAFVLPRMFVALDLGRFSGVSEINDEAVGMRLAPNPARQSTVLSVDGDVEVSDIVVTNLTGQVVRRVRAQGSRCEIDLAGLAPGVHYLTVTTSRGTHARPLLVQ